MSSGCNWTKPLRCACRQSKMIGGSSASGKKSHRQSHAKVRSGCITCKLVSQQRSTLSPSSPFRLTNFEEHCRIRRTKCDERKPSCLRCTSTGRKCDGYRGKEPLKFINATTNTEDVPLPMREAGPARATTLMSRSVFSMRVVSPNNPLLDFSGTEMEHRSLDFFRYEAAPALSGYFDAQFWSEFLPRVGYSEPPIQHALIALGSMYEFCTDGRDYPNIIQQRYALIQYNKAIRALKTCKVDDVRTLEITLITCFLFVCLDLLGGNPEQALSHLRNGLGILRGSPNANDRTVLIYSRKSTGPREILPDPKSVTEVLNDAFSRLSLQGSLCGRRQPDIYPSIGWSVVEDSQSARLPFKSLQEARLSLNKISAQCFQPLAFVEATDHLSIEAKPTGGVGRESLTNQLHYWNSRLALWVTDSLPNLPQEDIKGSRVLRLLSIIAIIWNTTTDDLLESAYDEHFESHKIIINLGLSFIQETITLSPSTTATISSASTPQSITAEPLQNYSKRAPLGTFTFEMGVIPALYFTAIKCRSPSLRRKAIEMLRKVVPPREGMWDARMLAGIAQRVVDVEEKGGSCSEESWPAETRRIHGIYITPEFNPVERRQRVVFTWRPNGPTSEWLQLDEIIFY